MKKTGNAQVSPDHYLSQKYDSKERWVSYWYQINEVLSLNPRNVLEIGVGNKTVSDYLKKIGIKVVTCDFDKLLKPDIIANVLNLPFKKNSFDVVLCAEVLEHLPFTDLPKALGEIHRVVKSHLVITLPHFSLTNIYIGAKVIPFIPKKQITIKVDFPFRHSFDGEHYWEIGKKKYDLGRVKKALIDSSFFIEKDYYPEENPRHHFFILSKKNVKAS